MTIGGLFMLGYLIASKKYTTFILFIKKFAPHLVVASIIGLVFGQIIYIYGTQLTGNSAISATIFSANPIIISFYMIFRHNESKSKWKIGGILLGFLGVLIIMTEMNFTQLFVKDNLLGNLLVFLGMSLWCFDVLISKIIFNRIENEKENENVWDSLDFNTITFLIAGLGMIPFLLLPGEFHALSQYTVKAWIGVFYLGIVSGGIGYVLFFKGLQKMEASKGINAFYFKPIFATILSFIIFATIPNIYFFIGLTLEMIALYLISK